MKQISNLLFTGLKNLQEVDLNFNYIQKLDDNTFVDLPFLRHVDLSGNRLTVITPKTFRGMQDLSYLNLHYNTLHSLPPGFLKDSPNINELNLARNRLETVDLNTLRGVRAIRSNFILHLKGELRFHMDSFSRSFIQPSPSTFVFLQNLKSAFMCSGDHILSFLSQIIL